MSSPWTTERVLALAPDPGSASAGQGLSSAKKWTGIGRSDRALWGLCQGSGKDPYQTRIDLSEPAFKCSCPSRKFPCKHGIGLLLLFAKDEKSFKAGDEPAWVADWLAGRSERAEKKVEKAKEAAAKPVDLEAQAKRAAQRESRVMDGVAECRVWLDDLVRRGLAAAQTEDGAFWDRAAGRMVDAQAPGLASYIKRTPEMIASGQGWHARTLDHLGRLHLLLTAAQKLGELPPDLAADVRTALGWTQSKEECLAGAGVADRWAVVGQITEEEDRLRVRRTWLVGRTTARRALVLDFAVGPQPMDASLVAGMEFDGELAFYPSRLPLRALVKSRGDAVAIRPTFGIAADATSEQALRRYAEALAVNPWTTRWPVLLENAVAMRQGDRWVIGDASGRGLPVRPNFAGIWRLLSVGGGAAITLAGEWDGEFISPLAAMTSSFDDLAPRWAA